MSTVDGWSQWLAENPKIAAALRLGVTVGLALASHPGCPDCGACRWDYVADDSDVLACRVCGYAMTEAEVYALIGLLPLPPLPRPLHRAEVSEVL